ncbi:MAG: hypothetical protein Q8R60_08800 [Mycobacteriales bacterium]|nr:hypothetical protein [Mycobacteriales bacterium]
MAALSLAFEVLAKDRASKELDNVGDALDRTGKKGEKFGKAVGAGMAIAAAAVGKFGFDAVKQASASEQAMGGVQSVFGDAAEKVEKFAKRSGKSLGLAESDYASLAAVVGSQLQRFGQSQDEAAESTDKLVTLGADLAATYGGSVADAVSAVSSLLKGERDPIEKYAVGINDAAIMAELASKGLGKLKGAALDQAKAQATLTLLMQQTTAAQGAAARESGTLEGQTIRVAAQYKNLSADLGARLLPIVSDAITKFTSMAEFIGRNSDVIVPLVTAVGTFATGLFIVTKAAAAFNAVSVLMGSSVTVALGPIGLIVLGVAALVAGLVIAYKNSETFRNIVQAVFKAVATAVLTAVDVWLGGFQKMFEVLAKIPIIGDKFKGVADKIQGARDKVTGLKDSLDKLPRVIPIRLEVGGNVGSTTGRLLDFERRALGGPVKAGRPYWVGDNPDGSLNRTSELFVPGRSGTIVPNKDLAGLGGGATYNLYVNGSVDEAQMMNYFRRMELLRA